MMAPELVIAKEFYEAFQRRDGESMAGFYSKNAKFCDPAFGELSGDEVGDMWRMLCSSGKDLRVTFTLNGQDGHQVHVDWVAEYTFSKTGRRVTNHVTSRLAIEDGKIIEHIDQFDFGTWAGQALGLMGRCFGWSSFLNAVVQKSARSSLEDFRRRRQR